ncbi:MAG: FeoA family protein [Ignisphaera sp.]|uniref:Ferrous iron transport protein A n=1 Tax=Ignisphaera aggregans TaxID=334771 RepID=A0A7C4D1Q1_9CREN
MAIVSLDKVTPGSCVKVIDVNVDLHLKSRLISMGIYRGAIVKILGVFQGHVVISLDSGLGRRIALSYGIARKILVSNDSTDLS